MTKNLPPHRTKVLAFLEGFQEHSGMRWHREGWAFMWRFNQNQAPDEVVHDEWSREAYERALASIGANSLDVVRWVSLNDIVPIMTNVNEAGRDPTHFSGGTHV